MPIPKRNLNRVGIAAYPDDAGGFVALASYDAIAQKQTADCPDNTVFAVCGDDTDGAMEFWCLRVWPKASAPVTDTGNGRIKPSDYHATANKRALFRTA